MTALLQDLWTWLDRDPIVAAAIAALVCASIGVIAVEAATTWLEHRADRRRRRARGGYVTDLQSLGHTKLGTTKTTQRRGGDRR